MGAVLTQVGENARVWATAEAFVALSADESPSVVCYVVFSRDFLSFGHTYSAENLEDAMFVVLR